LGPILSPTSQTEKVLCVDLDGTLIATDLLWESFLILLKTRAWSLFFLPVWLLKGKAHFKRQVAARVTLDPATLPYRKEVLEFLRREKASGREIVLATASDRRFADNVARHVGLFSAVLASDGCVNLSGARKLEAIAHHVGDRRFDYIGDRKADLPLWQAASEALLVKPTARLLKHVQRTNPDPRIVAPRTRSLDHVFKALRMHQWVKNSLLFVPLVTSHRIAEADLLLAAVCAFFSFSLCASSAYVANDLFDLEADRRHPTKRLRPFASGLLSIRTGLLLMATLLTAGLLIAAFLLPSRFLTALVLYTVVTTLYSFYLKRMVIADVVVLAGLHTLRVLAGAVAINVPLSSWLLAFSLFIFISLAFGKRCSELSLMEGLGQVVPKGRSYSVKDRPLLQSVGIASGYLSALVFALYITSHEVAALYRYPNLLWLVIPFLVYWVTRIWLYIHRGEMHDDPVVFTLRDWASYATGAIIGLVILIAH
jgi:4-hydroxybenzoate polyprenyltransferase/phosphoglycolate phosphatase-like HAD superfamily hydrolase